MPRTNLSAQFDADQRKEWKPKIIARNTFRYSRGNETVIRLHATDIARKLPDGSVILNSGGWKTVTTKDRMNGVLAGYSISQCKGLWSVMRHSDRASVPYFDGIQVPQCFDKGSSKSAATEKRESALREKIRKFVGKLDKLECLPAPSSGDCWFCMMQTKEGQSLGEAMKNYSCIVEHVKESYLHGSLIVNALKWAGYREPGFIWSLENSNMKREKNRIRLSAR